MLELKGIYGKDCKVFTDNVDSKALETIQSLLNNPVTEGMPVRIMPDTHDGKGIVIGFTMPMGEWVNPNHIGVDIGCGMLCAELHDDITSDMYETIDKRIRDVIPMGFNVHDLSNNDVFFNHIMSLDMLHVLQYMVLGQSGIRNLCDKIEMDYTLWYSSFGTLGGGNHFIELGKSEKTGKYYLTIHSGSRNFGKRVCDYHAKSIAGYKAMLSDKVAEIKNMLPMQEWDSAIKKEKKILADRKGYLSGIAKKEYLHDMFIAQKYASVNRYTILHFILRVMGWQCDNIIETVHNYIHPEDNIIRKGAVRAMKGEKLIIPMNMADGILLCEGKGNPDWNYSAPHGAGRVFSRKAAKELLSMKDFQARMKEVYSSSVVKETLDESPMAYKPTSEICNLIEPTVEILDIIKPVINLKAIS